jgi:WD40 repeat protein
LWNTVTGLLIKSFLGHKSNVRSIAFSSDGLQLASCSDDKTIKIWDLGTGLLIKTISGLSNGAESIVFSPDGTKLVSYGVTVK